MLAQAEEPPHDEQQVDSRFSSIMLHMRRDLEDFSIADVRSVAPVPFGHTVGMRFTVPSVELPLFPRL
jgi:hypothetical protein